MASCCDQLSTPRTHVQLCLVHLVHHSLNFVSWKQRKEMANDLEEICNATTIEQADANLEEFADKWDATHPMRLWHEIILLR